jgi:hypothetical protein
MDLKIYIKELLLQNEGLVIPGFGGFVSEYEPASFDVNQNKFLPPTKKLLFKSEYSFNDTVFAEYIEKKENSNKDDATKKIDEFVSQIKNDLKKGAPFVITNVGTLTQSIKGEIHFEQDKNFNLLTDSFGLKSINIKPLSEKAPTKSKTEVITHKRSLKKPLFIGASLIIIMALVLYTWTITEGFTDYNNFSSLFRAKSETIVQQEMLTTKSVEYLDSIAQADSIKASINKTIDVTTVKKDALFYTTQKKEQEIAKPIYTKFNIIAGSFQSRNKAEIFSKELNKKGFTT